MRPIVVDTGEPKRKLAMEMGAEAFVDFQEGSAPEAVIRIAGGVGAHAVFVTAPAAYKTCAEYTGDRIGAIVMCTGIPPINTMTLNVGPCQYIFNSLEVKGTLVGSRSDTAAA